MLRCTERRRRGARLAATRALVGACFALATLDARAEEPSLDEIDYDPTVLPPDGVRSRLLWTGAALTLGWYGASLGTSFLWDSAPNAGRLRLPIVGPWAALGEVRCGSEEESCDGATLAFRTALAVVSGVGQIGGIAVLLEGALLPGAERPATKTSASPVDSWLAIPTVTADGFGVAVSGSF